MKNKQKGIEVLLLAKLERKSGKSAVFPEIPDVVVKPWQVKSLVFTSTIVPTHTLRTWIIWLFNGEKINENRQR